MELKQVEKEAQTARRGALVFTIFALLGAAVVVWMLARVIGSRYSGGPSKMIVVATKKIPPFSELRPGQMKLAEWPVESVPDGTFDSIDAVLNQPRRNLRMILKGEPIIAQRLAGPEAGVGVDYSVEPGMRAFVVRVDESLATAGLIRPGVLVDVVSTLKDLRQGEVASKLVLQSVEVLAVGEATDATVSESNHGQEGAATKTDSERERIERKRVVTLLVTPGQVETLALVKEEGTIDLALRNSTDTGEVETPGVSLKSLMAVKARNETKPPSRKPGKSGRGGGGPTVYKVGGR